MTTIYADVETTGLNPYHNHVVELGAIATVGDVELDHFSEICNPGEQALSQPGVDKALHINGLTYEQIRAARPIEVVAEAAREWLARWREVTLIGYNSRGFDSKFLAQPPWEWNRLSWGADVMLDVSRGRKWCKLGEAAVRFGVPWDGTRAHSALYDVRATHRVHRAWLKQREGAIV